MYYISSLHNKAYTNILPALVKRVVRLIPRSLPYYENTGDHRAEDESDSLVRELMKIRPHKPLFTILSQYNSESITQYSSKLLELLYLLLKEKQLDDSIRIELENSLTNLISFIPWVHPDSTEKLKIDNDVSFKNRQSIPQPKHMPGDTSPTYPNGYLSKILIDNFDALTEFSSSYFNLTLSTMVTKYIVELIYQLYYWEVVHLVHINPKISDFLELIGFELTQTTFGPIIKPPANYLNDNLLQGLQYPFPYPFYNYSYHSFDTKVEQKKFDRVNIKPYLDITLKNVDGSLKKRRKSSAKHSFSEEAITTGVRHLEGMSDSWLRENENNQLGATRASGSLFAGPGDSKHAMSRSSSEAGRAWKSNQDERKPSHKLVDQDLESHPPQLTGLKASPPASTPAVQYGPFFPLQSPFLRNHLQHGLSPVPYQHYSFQSLPPPTSQSPQQPHQSHQFSNSPLLPIGSRNPSLAQSTKSNEASPTLSQQEQRKEFPNITPISNYPSSQSNILPSISKLTDQLERGLSERLLYLGLLPGASFQSTGLGITTPIQSLSQQLPRYSPRLGVAQQNELHPEIKYNTPHEEHKETISHPPTPVGEARSQPPPAPPQLGKLRADHSDPEPSLSEKNKRFPRHGVIHQCHLIDPSTNAKCLKIFYGKNELLRHQEFVHATKKRIYKCLYCERSGARVQQYPRHDSLARHIRRKHGITGRENKMAVNYAKENVIIVDDAEAINIQYAPEEPLNKLQPGESIGPLRSPDFQDEESYAYEKFKEEVDLDLREMRKGGFGNQIAVQPTSQVPISIPLPPRNPQESQDFKKPQRHMTLLYDQGRKAHSHTHQQFPVAGNPSLYHHETLSNAGPTRQHADDNSNSSRSQNYSPSDATNRLFSIYMGPNSVPSSYTKSGPNKSQTSPSLNEPGSSSAGAPSQKPPAMHQFQGSTSTGSSEHQTQHRASYDSQRSSVKLPLIHDIDNEIGHIYRDRG